MTAFRPRRVGACSAALRTLWITCACAAVLFLLSGCRREDKQLIVGILADVSSAPMLLAKAEGCQEVDFEVFKSAADRDAALQSGAIDGAVSDVLGAAFALQGGFPVRITSRTEGSYKLLGAPNSGIDRSDLNGKTVALSPGTLIEYAADLLAGEHSLVKRTVRDMPLRVEMLLASEVELAAMPEPLAAAAVKRGARVVGDSADLGMDVSVMLFSERAIAGKRGAIEDFYTLLDDMGQRLNALGGIPPEELFGAGLYPEQAKGAFTLPHYRPAAMIGREGFDACVDWMVEKKLLDRAVSFGDAVTFEFIE